MRGTLVEVTALWLFGPKGSVQNRLCIGSVSKMIHFSAIYGRFPTSGQSAWPTTTRRSNWKIVCRRRW